MPASDHLQVTKLVRAPRERVFAAWTMPDMLKRWWGPAGVTCPEAHVELKVGGKYRLANLQPDGQVVWICGTFEEITPPSKLVYDWKIEAMGVAATLVTVEFNEHPEGTELVVTHERFTAPEIRDMHMQGWGGCLDKLEALLG